MSSCKKTKIFGFPRKERLRGEKRISQLFAEGKGSFVYPVRYIVQVERIGEDPRPTVEADNGAEISAGDVDGQRAAKRTENGKAQGIVGGKGRQANISVKESNHRHEPGINVLVSVPKRNHKRANKRNLLKRRLRESFRTRNSVLRQKAVENNMRISIALVYSTKEVLEYKIIEHALDKIISQIAFSI